MTGMNAPPIPTPRFELVSMSLRFMELLVAHDLGAADAEIGAIVPVEMPDTLDNFLQFRIADRGGRHAPDRRIVRLPHTAGAGRPGRGRLQHPAAIPPPGRRDRGRPRALRLGARPGGRSVPCVGRA
jgi:hypothetical protein